MSQPTNINVATSKTTGRTEPGNFTVELNAIFNAMLSAHSGASRPSYALAGTTWLSTADGIAYLFDGKKDVPATPGDAIVAVSESMSGYTLVCDPVVGSVSEWYHAGIPFRQREQRTSWYNETLVSGDWLGQAANETAARALTGAADGDYYHNTTDGKFYSLDVTSGQTEVFRGNTAKFPQLFTILPEASRIVILDAGDPDLPMWMVFTISASNIIRGTVSLSSVGMFNGEMVTTDSGSYAGSSVNFLIDGTNPDTDPRNAIYNGNIAQRNGAKGSVIGSPLVVNQNCNDVAITVLPDAPIDQATGLPVPTIAVATDGGVSVISQDGDVWDVTSGAVNYISLDSSGRMWVQPVGFALSYGSIPTAGATVSTWRDGYYDASTTAPALIDVTGNLNHLVDAGVVSSSAGLCFLYENIATPTSGMVAYMTSTYLTGWMVGDIKGAFLSSTDATDLVGSGELVTNGTFDTDTDWTKGTGWTISAGVATHAAGTGSNLSQTLTLISGETYVVEYTISGVTAGTVRAQFDSAEIGISNGSNGTYYETFVAPNGSPNLIFSAGSSFNGSIDNISVKLADEDRSVNDNGLIINGTVTRTAVSTGAELVAYSGFSASNYLEQPYNSDLDFGTGDFCVMGWIKDWASGNYIFDRADGAGAGRWYLYNAAGNFGTNSGPAGVSLGKLNDSSNWGHLAIVRASGTTTYYVDGVAVGSGANALSIDGSAVSSSFRVGTRYDLTSPLTGSLTLLRISATAPSADQIKKIYEDEKYLFRENAACTLYGASDAVTALAHDSVTDLLHVGTSAGRSVFSGLRRVSNTTNAVGAGIGAYDSLVIDD